MRKGGSIDQTYKPCANATWAEGVKDLCGPPKEPVEGEEPEVARAIDGEGLRITNYVQEAAMFEAAGVGGGFTRIGAVALFTGMRKLANKEPVKSVRIFGKIIGLQRDYLICECEWNDDYDGPPPEEGEEPAEGEEDAAPKGV